MFDDFYDLFEEEDHEVFALIAQINSSSDEGGCHVLSALVLGMKFVDTGVLTTSEEELVWPVSDDELQGEKGWERFHDDQICRLKVRRMKASCCERPDERSWCLSEVVEPDADWSRTRSVARETQYASRHPGRQVGRIDARTRRNHV